VASAAAEAGISQATLRRAAGAGGVVKQLIGERGTPGQVWVWSMSASTPEAEHLEATHTAASDRADEQVGVEPLEVLAGLVLESGERWGACATEVQWRDATAVLAPDPSPRRFWIGRTRGYSKTGDAAGYVVAAVLGGLVPGGGKGFFCAADRDQAALTAAAIDEWVHRTEGLGGLVVVERDRVRFPHHRVDIEIMSSDAASAWGRRGHFWVIDELASWADVPKARAFYEAISTSWPKVPGARVCITTTAGSPAHFSRVVYEQACAEESWAVFDSHDVAPWLNAADVETERRRLSAGSFARLWENRWTEAEDHLVTSENLRRCLTLTGGWPLKPVRGKRYVVAIDIGVKIDNTVIAVGHSEVVNRERHVVLDAMDVFEPKRGQQVPLANVEARVETLAKRYNNAPVVFDPAQALSMMQALKARGVKVHEHTFSARSNDQMTTTLSTMLRDGQIDLPDDPSLIDELLHIRVVETSTGLLSVDTVPGRHDDRVDALGIVAVHLMQRPASRPGIGISAAHHTLEPDRRPFGTII
jgi:hypothetical protein